MIKAIKRPFQNSLWRFQTLRGSGARRPCFTLVELLVVIAIIGVLASMTLAALSNAVEDAKATRTRAQMAKLNELIFTRWESYRTRSVRIIRVSSDTPFTIATNRLAAIRELQRLEMPDRITDVITGLSVLSNYPSVTRQYRTAAASAIGSGPGGDGEWGEDSVDDDGNGITDDISDFGLNNSDDVLGWTINYEGAECLYLILAAMRDGGTTGIDFLFEKEIGDTDGDGMLEVLDAWGNPIVFIRWAPGFSESAGPDTKWGKAGTDDDGDMTTDNFSERNWAGTDDLPTPSELQTRDAFEAPDPFDPLKVDSRWGDGIDDNDPFALYPLIYSFGRDGGGGIVAFDFNPATPTTHETFVSNDPYAVMTKSNRQLGEVFFSSTTYTDNIHNHFLNTRTQ